MTVHPGQSAMATGRTRGWIPGAAGTTLPAMKRIVGTALWFMVGWTFGSMLTYVVDLPEVLLGVAFAVPTAAFVWFDPLHVVWTRQRRRSDSRRTHDPNKLADAIESRAARRAARGLPAEGRRRVN
jgi:hypothetical protein